MASAAPEDARARPGDGCEEASLTANLPASASGGGALKIGRGVAGGEGVLAGTGEGSRGGEDERPGAGLLEGGGAGGGPLLLDEVAPVLSGLNLGAMRPPGGGGGGGALPLLFAERPDAIPLAIS